MFMLRESRETCLRKKNVYKRVWRGEEATFLLCSLGACASSLGYSIRRTSQLRSGRRRLSRVFVRQPWKGSRVRRIRCVLPRKSREDIKRFKKRYEKIKIYRDSSRVNLSSLSSFSLWPFSVPFKFAAREIRATSVSTDRPTSRIIYIGNVVITLEIVI